MNIKKWILSTTCMLLVSAPVFSQENTSQCVAIGSWVDTNDRKTKTNLAIFNQLKKQQVILLGEDHDNAEHHRWQLHTIAQLYVQQPKLAIGFEAFPRATQALLDQWVKGELNEKDFLEAVDWKTIWAYDPQYYMPMLHFARMHQIPVIALNVQRTLVRHAGKVGWENLSKKDREGVGNLAPAKLPYQEMLAEIFMQHKPASHGEEKGKEKTENTTDNTQETHAQVTDHSTPEIPEGLYTDPMFKRFVQGQLIWDRAMAEASANALKNKQVETVVNILGAGHILPEVSVPYQLASMGIHKVISLMPWDGRMECEQLNNHVAHYVRGLALPMKSETAAAKKLKLGVYLELSAKGVRVTRLATDSIAQEAGIAVGDIITQVAGKKITQVSEIIEIIQAMTLGVWLPMKVNRDGDTIEIIAKFSTRQ